MRLLALDRAFDGAAFVGDWVETSSIDDPLHAVIEVTINEETVARRCLADMCTSLDELLSVVSTRCSIKMGDLLFTGDAGEGHILQPGDRLRATLNGRQVLDVNVKL